MSRRDRDVKMPTSVKVGPVTYAISTDPTAHKLTEHGANQRLMGMTDTEALVITVKPDMAPDAMRQTLVHECLHAMLSVSGYAIQADDSTDREEHTVTALENPLLALLNDNPDLVAWLLTEA